MNGFSAGASPKGFLVLVRLVAVVTAPFGSPWKLQLPGIPGNGMKQPGTSGCPRRVPGPTKIGWDKYTYRLEQSSEHVRCLQPAKGKLAASVLGLSGGICSERALREGKS